MQGPGRRLIGKQKPRVKTRGFMRFAAFAAAASQPNLKLMPPRMMFSLSETWWCAPARNCRAGRRHWPDRRTDIRPWRVQFGANAYSTPAPAVQPVCVELLKGNSPAPRLDVGEGGAAGAVEQHPIPCPAGAAAGRGEPIASRLATDAGAGRVGGGAVRFAPIAVAFDAEHERADLIVGADRAADQEAAGVEISGPRTGSSPVAVAERAAAVDADIEAGPAIEGNDRNVGRRRGTGARIGRSAANAWPPAASANSRRRSRYASCD